MSNTTNLLDIKSENLKILNQAEFLERAIGIGAILRFLASGIISEKPVLSTTIEPAILRQLLESKQVLIEKYKTEKIKPNNQILGERLLRKLNIEGLVIPNINNEEMQAILNSPNLPQLLVELDIEYHEAQSSNLKPENKLKVKPKTEVNEGKLAQARLKYQAYLEENNINYL